MQVVFANREKAVAFEECLRHNKALYPNDDDVVRIAQFIELLALVEKLPAGDYVEMGTYEGGSARWIWRQRAPSTRLYCFDTFDGFPEEDMEFERAIRPNHNWSRASFKPVRLGSVRTTIACGDQSDDLSLIPGRIPESLAGFGHLRFRFAHLDMDLHEPTRHAIAWVWPRLEPGGIAVFHDYFNSSTIGVKMAIDDYFEDIGLVGIPMGDVHGSAVFSKALR